MSDQRPIRNPAAGPPPERRAAHIGERAGPVRPSPGMPPPRWSAARLLRMAAGLPLLLVFWIYEKSDGLFYTVGGPKVYREKGRINWRHPFALPAVVVIALALPLILAAALLFHAAQWLRRWRSSRRSNPAGDARG